jgi:hypothetical protein
VNLRYWPGIIGAALLLAQDRPAPKPVSVQIYENVPKESLFRPDTLNPTETYSEPVFAFVATPTKFAPNAIPLDRSAPFVLRAQYRRALAAGQYQFRLRARGAAVFQVDGKDLLKTNPQKPNTSGDDPVPPPVEKTNSPLRPLPTPTRRRSPPLPWMEPSTISY